MISLTQLTILFELEEGPLSPEDLNEKLEFSSGNLYGSLAILRSEGLILLDDGMFSLTPKGCDLIERCLVK